MNDILTIVDPDHDTGRTESAVSVPSQERIRRGVLERLFGESGPSTDSVQFGRYRVDRRLGSGGMGTVFSAYDPDLERHVAIKVLHAELSRRARDRLFDEAKTMARLTHPNVVGIYDIGEQDEQIFLAMEKVDGGTLREWAEGAEHGWREIVEVYRAAARGLYAAHEAGIIHRDFKPDNVLVSEQGDVKVTDFGIARTAQSLRERIAASIGPTQPDDEDVSSAAPMPLPALGGTPAYMAPEYIRGAPGDERSDQFSFFVSLYESLCGERPFDGSDVLSLFTKIFTGERAMRPPRSYAVPKTLWAIVDRGLHLDPSRRYASMKEVEAALASTLTSRWRRVVVPLMGVTVVASAVGGAALHRHITQTDCDDEAAQIEAVWGSERRTRVRDAMLGTELSFAARSWEQVDAHVSAWVEDWTQGRVQACMDRGNDLHASRRVQCFDAQQDELSGLLGVLAEPDAATVEHAVASLTSLPEPARCADDDWLLAGVPVPPPPQARPQVRQAFETLSRARALVHSLRPEEAAALVEAPMSLAESLDYPPLRSSALATQALVNKGQGDYEGARTLLIDALAAAYRVDAVMDAARAAVLLIQVEGGLQERTERGYEWGRLADGHLTRLGEGGVALALDQQLYLAQLDRFTGRTQQALERAEQLLRTTVERYGEQDIRVPVALKAVATAHSQLDHYEHAITMQRRAVELQEQLLGPDHPAIARMLDPMSVSLAMHGRLEEAEQASDRAIERTRAALGSDHPELAGMLNNRANIALMRSQADVAAPLLSEALRIKLLTLGPDHPAIARTRMNLGTVERQRGHSEAALRHYRAAMEDTARVHGTRHDDYTNGLANIASVLVDLGRFAEAKEHLMEALTLVPRADEGQGLVYYFLALADEGLEDLPSAAEHAARARAQLAAQLGPDHPRTGRATLLHGELLLELGRLAEAEPLITRGRDIVVATDPGTKISAGGWFAMARLRWATGDRAEAVVLARRAREEAAADAGGAGYAAVIEGWLGEHPI